MQLTYAEVANFRSLEKASVRVDSLTTLIVGRNNSGKTSFVNLFEKFFGEEDARFVLEDFSTSRIADIKKAISRYDRAQKRKAANDHEASEKLLEQAFALLPAIRLLLTIAYEEEDDLAPITDLILDLDENCHEVKIEAAVIVERPADFLMHAWQASQRAGFNLDKYLRKSFGTYFTSIYHAIGADAASPQYEEIPRALVRRVLSVKFIYAQTKFDDNPSDKTRNLSKTFEAYYKANSDDNHNHNIEKIESALALASRKVDQNYDELFSPIFDDLQTFGVGTIAPIQKPRIVSLIEPSGVLRGSTRIQYPSGDSAYPLPEGHNGLGYSKLIYTILQVVSFFETYRRSTPSPALQLLFIEEPEAHLHPQMQEAFIKNIQGFIKGKPGWKVQVIITTHSSHIVASSGFESVRYFDCTGPHLTVKDLSAFQNTVKPDPRGEETLRFLKQYMVLHRCDMFFADKVVLIEGTTERLLLPEMIRKCARGLLHQYVSVIEVGDAYAARFKELLAFIGVQTLIITDIDSVSPMDGRTSCPTNTDGAITSNTTLKKWLPGEKSIKLLMEADDATKTRDNVRVAYQVPESAGMPCGRSFEDAFIIANSAVLAKNSEQLALKANFTNEVGAALTAEEIEENAGEIAKKLSKKKTNFAFDIMLLDDWAVPRYIQEGLQWLI
ncbi:ATP-dependent endonuclease [Sphaerisporangium sp. NPDC049003]|uniref:ATP-dependent nuclease n=1 Tax=Sphaerisporangium sp. NPDC049003 TaxID=3364517 RepID=UPI0037234D04